MPRIGTAVGDIQWLYGGFERADVPVIEEVGGGGGVSGHVVGRPAG